MSYPRPLAAFVMTATVAVAAVAVGLVSGSPAHASGLDIYVSPTGSDTAAGTTSSKPLKTIQLALNEAVPGSTIHLAPGVYHQSDLITKVNGTASAPITIKGSDTGLDLSKRGKTTVAGTGRVFSINNSYYRVMGFTLDGEPGLGATALPGKLASTHVFKNSVQRDVVDSSLIFVGAADSTRGIHGVVIDNMALEHAGGDCVRIANGAYNNTVEQSTIEWCGMAARSQAGVFAYHNGEGIYLGTSPKSTDRSMHADDNTSYNLIADNVIYTYGSECLDIKENSHDNVFRNNHCGFNDEPIGYAGSNIEIRGYHNTVTDNTITGSLGYGLKLASDSKAYPQGGNVVTYNAFSGDVGSPIINSQTTPQGKFCGDSFMQASYVQGLSVGSATSACPRAS